MENIELRREIEKQLDNYKVVLGRISYDFMEEKLRKYILSNEELMSLYGKSDVDTVLLEYVDRINSIKNKLYTSDDIELNIMKLYEYIRLTTFKENISVRGCEKYLEQLGDSSISPAFIGKGSSNGIIRYFRDLLPSNVESFMTAINANDPRVYDLNSLKDIVIVDTDNGMKSMDVVKYNGKSSSMESDLFISLYSGDVMPFEASSELINQARKEVTNMLIEELNIDVLSDKIINDNMSDYEKQCAIIGCLSTFIVQSNMPVKFSLVNINGHFMEIGKAMELFFAYNNISYDISNNDKEDSIYRVSVDRDMYYLDPKEMFSSGYVDVNDRLHYKEIEGYRYYLIDTNSMLLSDTRKYLNESRKNTKGIFKGIEKSLVG